MKIAFKNNKWWNLLVVLCSVVMSFAFAIGIQAVKNPIDFNWAVAEEPLNNVQDIEEHIESGSTEFELFCHAQTNVIYIELKEAVNEGVIVEIYQGEGELDNQLISGDLGVGEQAKRFYLQEGGYDNFYVVIKSENSDIEVGKVLSGFVSQKDLEMTKISKRDTTILMVLLFVSLLLMYIKRKKMINFMLYTDRTINYQNEKIQNKYVVLVMFIVFVLMVMLGLNISHMEQYKMVIPGNIASLDPIIFGESRAIRSDEWLGINTLFHNMTKENMGMTNWLEIVSFYVQPQNWGFVFLPDANAFAFYTLMPYLIAGIAIYLFLDILIPDKKWIAILGSFIICFAPENLWWWGPETIGSSLAIVVAFYYFFVKTRVRDKVICSIVLASLLPTYVISVYPAWDVPMVYVAVTLVITLFIKNEKIKFNKKDLIYIFSVVIWSLIAYFCYYFSQKENLEVIMNTVYPGKRVSGGGGLSINYLFHYLMMSVTPGQDVVVLNNSENSAYLALYPLPLLLFVVDFKHMIKNKAIVGLQIIATILFVYSFIGMPIWLTTITGLSYSIGARAFTVFGATCVILMVLEVNWSSRIKIERALTKETAKIALFNIGILGFMLLGVINEVYAFSELGIISSIMMVLLVLLLGDLTIFGYKKSVYVIWGIYALVCMIDMIPINNGIGIMTETSIAQEIQRIESAEEGKWITLDDMVMAKYVNAQGADCINVLSYPPRFDLFYPLDETKEFEDTYNRYAHMKVDIIDSEESSFDLIRQDFIQINLSEKDIDLWDVKYIVTKNELSINTSELYTELLYRDPLDNYLIYEVDYK